MTLTFAVLGDSIAYGQGAARSADTIGGRLAAQARAAGVALDARVYAVPGARSDSLAAQTARALAAGADLALIIIGANDLTHFVPADVAAGQLGTAVGALDGAGVRVVVAPAPDLSSVPWIPVQLRQVVREASLLLRRAQSRAALAAGAKVVDLGADGLTAFATDPALFSPDRFHPSSAGYALITAALAPAVFAAAREAGAAKAADQGRPA